MLYKSDKARSFTSRQATQPKSNIEWNSQFIHMMAYVWCVMGGIGGASSIKYIYSKTSTTLSAIKHHSLTSTHRTEHLIIPFMFRSLQIQIHSFSFFISLNCWNRIVLACEMSLETVPKRINLYFFLLPLAARKFKRQRSESCIEINLELSQYYVFQFSICRPSFMAYSDTNIVIKWLPWAFQKLSKLLRLLTLWNRLAM